MATRRSFLETLAAGAAAASFPGRVKAAGSTKPLLGLQLYSLRNQLKLDVPGTLKQVKDWGFEEVEAYSDFGAGIAGALKDAGLRCAAMHVGYDKLTSDLDGRA